MSRSMFGEHAPEDQDRPYLFELLWRILRPRQGWVLLSLTWVAVICPPTAAIAGGQVVGLEPTVLLATSALVLAWWLANHSASGRLALVLMVLTGMIADLWWGVRVIQPGSLIGQIARRVAWYIGERIDPAPPLTWHSEQFAALDSYIHRVGWWFGALIEGRGAPDNLVVIGLAGLATWSIACWAGWEMARRGRPFRALLPSGIALVWQIYWSGSEPGLLVVFLGAATLLLVLGRLAVAMADWEREGVDYSPEIRLDAALVAAGWAVVVMVSAPVLPALTSGRASATRRRPVLGQCRSGRYASPLD